MNRMAVFVFYDFEGFIDDYVRYLLDSLMEITKKTVVVSNGKLSKKEREKLEIFTENIYERENKGFDAGAYKDVFTNFMKNEKWENWDEIILLNDTFYGPVYPWRDVFEKMDKQNVDFWGMTKQENYKCDGDIVLPTHVQSYFLAIRKKLFLSTSFRLFWEQMEYPLNLHDAIFNFEIRFTYFFRQKNFKYSVYTDVCGVDFPINNSELIYAHYITELLSVAKMPLVKRKALTLTNFEKAQTALSYISEHTMYDVDLIKRHMLRLDNLFQPFGYRQLNEFCKRYSKIYIYGNGKIGNLVSKYFQCKGIKFEKYIVTEKKNTDGDNVISYDSFVMDNDTGIILALGMRNLEEVLLKIACNMPSANLLIPNYGIVLSDYDR